MKIIHLEASTGWGGQEIRILREAEGMRQRGHELLFAGMKGAKLLDAACKAGFTCRTFSFHRRSWIWTLMTLSSWMRKEGVEVINTHSSLDSWLGGIAGRLIGIPVLRTRHLSAAIRKGWNSRILYGMLADAVVTTSACMVPVILAQSGKQETHCSSIPTGIDPEKMVYSSQEVEEFRKKLGIASTDFLVGTACVMRSWKGILDLLQAADTLRDVPNLRWVVIGGGHEEVYRSEAARRKLEGIVYFTGHLSNPLPAIASLDLFTLLSTANEGVSQALLQAAWLKRPLLATTVGGSPEVCQEGYTGLLIPPFSPERVAESVLYCKANASFIKGWGEEARRLVEKKFLFAQMLDQMEEVYRLISR
ncbi:MAG: glycosyltransferase family 4 protein [Verrucomicrobiota bacterium]|nr:glycosyltransferase family 4 protein [Verrucomicrobiota bacterium]